MQDMQDLETTIHDSYTKSKGLQRTLSTRIFLKIDNSTSKNSNVSSLRETKDPNKFDYIITNPTHSILMIEVSVNAM